jgi:hypothetical protein
MKIPAIVFLGLLTAPALAQSDKPICVDAMRGDNYNARPISPHDVLARNAIGAEKRSVRLGTSCIHIDRAANVGLHSFGHCIARGDDVAVTVPGGPGETCKVTSVTPGEDYAGAKYKYPD